MDIVIVLNADTTVGKEVSIFFSRRFVTLACGKNLENMHKDKNIIPFFVDTQSALLVEHLEEIINDVKRDAEDAIVGLVYVNIDEFSLCGGIPTPRSFLQEAVDKVANELNLNVKPIIFENKEKAAFSEIVECANMDYNQEYNQ
ncbi:hypothetical protein M0R04_05915 [Candidatus Dojkabacteria bacterium]|jgi:hypothetical protein|nr:hypothetical protein [Candidatus Dojkabacteria bacterium]